MSFFLQTPLAGQPTAPNNDSSDSESDDDADDADEMPPNALQPSPPRGRRTERDGARSQREQPAAASPSSNQRGRGHAARLVSCRNRDSSSDSHSDHPIHTPQRRRLNLNSSSEDDSDADLWSTPLRQRLPTTPAGLNAPPGEERVRPTASARREQQLPTLDTVAPLLSPIPTETSPVPDQRVQPHRQARNRPRLLFETDEDRPAPTQQTSPSVQLLASDSASSEDLESLPDITVPQTPPRPPIAPQVPCRMYILTFSYIYFSKSTGSAYNGGFAKIQLKKLSENRSEKIVNIIQLKKKKKMGGNGGMGGPH